VGVAAAGLAHPGHRPGLPGVRGRTAISYGRGDQGRSEEGRRARGGRGGEGRRHPGGQGQDVNTHRFEHALRPRARSEPAPFRTRSESLAISES